MHEDEKEKTVTMDYPFEKSEYNYYATALVFGSRSPHMKNFSAFSLDIFRTRNLTFSEMSGLTPEGSMGIVRHLRIDEHRLFETSHTDMRSEINKIVTYVDSGMGFHISDSLFSDEEFEYFQQNWNDTIENKIRTLGMLIRSLQVRDIKTIPLMVNEYLNISKTLLDHAEFFLVGKNAQHK
jgi:hypothetical protein